MSKRAFFLFLAMVFCIMCSDCNLPSKPGQLGGSNSSQANQSNEIVTPVPKTVGSGALEIHLGVEYQLPSMQSSMHDDAKATFSIFQSTDKAGVPVFNKFVIEGDGKTQQVASWKGPKCSSNGDQYRQGLVSIRGTMTGNFDSSQKDACKLKMEVSFFYNSSYDVVTDCQLSGVDISAQTGNWSINLNLPLITGYGNPIGLPGGVIGVATLKNLMIGNGSTGGCNVTQKQ